jgi:hypothetical protein
MTRQSRLSSNRGLYGTYKCAAIVEDRDIGKNKLAMALFFDERVGLSNGQMDGFAD